MAENGWNSRRRKGSNPSSFCLPKLSDKQRHRHKPDFYPRRQALLYSPKLILVETEQGLPWEARLESVFGYKLDIQIPSPMHTSSSESTSLGSLSDFGIKTRNPNLLGHNSAIPPYLGLLSPREMKMSKDYTCCVISRGITRRPPTSSAIAPLRVDSNVVLAQFSVSPESYEFGEKQSFLKLLLWKL